MYYTTRIREATSVVQHVPANAVILDIRSRRGLVTRANDFCEGILPEKGRLYISKEQEKCFACQLAQSLP